MTEKMKIANLDGIFDTPPEKFLVVLDTDDENEYNNPPEFTFENYQQMCEFVHSVFSHGEKDLKVIITKGAN